MGKYKGHCMGRVKKISDRQQGMAELQGMKCLACPAWTLAKKVPARSPWRSVPEKRIEPCWFHWGLVINTCNSSVRYWHGYVLLGNKMELYHGNCLGPRWSWLHSAGMCRMGPEKWEFSSSLSLLPPSKLNAAALSWTSLLHWFYSNNCFILFSSLVLPIFHSPFFIQAWCHRQDHPINPEGHFPDTFREICRCLWSADPFSKLRISPCPSLTTDIIAWESRAASFCLCCSTSAGTETAFFQCRKGSTHPTHIVLYSGLGWERVTYKRKLLKIMKTIWVVIMTVSIRQELRLKLRCA